MGPREPVAGDPGVHITGCGTWGVIGEGGGCCWKLDPRLVTGDSSRRLVVLGLSMLADGGGAGVGGPLASRAPPGDWGRGRGRGCE